MIGKRKKSEDQLELVDVQIIVQRVFLDLLRKGNVILNSIKDLGDFISKHLKDILSYFYV